MEEATKIDESGLRPIQENTDPPFIVMLLEEYKGALSVTTTGTWESVDCSDQT